MNVATPQNNEGREFALINYVAEEGNNMPGLVPELHGMKWAYDKLKRGITMNANVLGSIEGVLSRSEMKLIKGGSGFTTCSCFNISGQSQGTVQCSEDIDLNTCCQVHHDETFAANCEPSSELEVN